MATAALAVTVTGLLPVFLVSVAVFQLGPDLGFGPGTLGALVAGFFTCSALAAFGMGRSARATSTTGCVRAAALVSAACLFSIGLLVRDTASLAVVLLLAGLSNGFGQPASNALIAAAVPWNHQGVAYGAKQAAIPLSGLLGGLAVPLVALPYGWRPVFLGAGALAVLVAAGVPRGVPTAGTSTTGASPAAGPFRWAPLLVLSSGLVLAAGTGNALGTFFVASAVAAGEHPGTAGLLAAVGGAGGAVARVVLGLLADRYEGRWLAVVAVLVATGAAGHGLLATGDRVLLPVAVLLAYCTGWAWAGLSTYVVVRMHPDSAARATGVAQAGVALGAALGPLTFGAVSAALSFQAAWTGTAVCSLLAGLTVAGGRAMLLRERPLLLEAHRTRGHLFRVR